MNRYEIFLSAAAKIDIDDAYYWYEVQVPGLGKQFIATFENDLKVIQRHPASYRVVYSSFRKLLLTKFPYSVYYLIHEEERLVYIEALIHNRTGQNFIDLRLGV